MLRRAAELGAHIHIDMESLDSREAVLDLVLEVLGEPEFSTGPSAGLVLQAYLRDSPEQLRTILGWARTSGRTPPLTVRLVKGAYWDHELVQARQHGWPAPVFEVKADCDRNYEALTRGLLDARPLVRVAVASHNLRSVAHAIAYGCSRTRATTRSCTSRPGGGHWTSCWRRRSPAGTMSRSSGSDSYVRPDLGFTGAPGISVSENAATAP